MEEVKNKIIESMIEYILSMSVDFLLEGDNDQTRSEFQNFYIVFAKMMEKQGIEEEELYKKLIEIYSVRSSWK